MVEQLQQAKDDIKFWTDKFQKEQTEHSNTQKQMIQAKSDQKDAELFAKNQQIEASSLKRELDVIKARNAELQTSSNEIAATNESMGRQMNTDKVIMEQFSKSKAEYIARLRKDLDAAAEKHELQICHLLMACEDQRSAAFLNYEKLVSLGLDHEELQQISKEQGAKMKVQQEEIERLQRQVRLNEMEYEDHTCNIFYKQ